MPAPNLVAAITCNVKTVPPSELWEEMKIFTQFAAASSMAKIKERPAIHATRNMYKKLGKDPNRYRPSSEALCRRIIKGQPLYRINTLVDLINLISLKTGYSIGGFDLNLIEGDLTLGVGRANEPFNAIGRGQLNIEGLPVYRDNIGGIGTPTSDEERTKILDHTNRLLMIINAYSGEEGLQEAVELSIRLLKQYAAATAIDTLFK